MLIVLPTCSLSPGESVERRKHAPPTMTVAAQQSVSPPEAMDTHAHASRAMSTSRRRVGQAEYALEVGNFRYRSDILSNQVIWLFR